MFEFSREKPIYLQIAEWLENEILKGNIREGERLPVAGRHSRGARRQPDDGQQGRGRAGNARRDRKAAAGVRYLRAARRQRAHLRVPQERGAHGRAGRSDRGRVGAGPVGR